MVVTFDKPVRPDDMGLTIEGFSIAGADGKYYMAHAAYQSAAKKVDFTKIHVWSPLVKEPVAIRYAWATSSPMGNLKVNGKEWLPLPTFRTDSWNWPESEDPLEKVLDAAKQKAMKDDSIAQSRDPQARRSQTGGGNSRAQENIGRHRTGSQEIVRCRVNEKSHNQLRNWL